jgi:AcrR family transcriptional regulator
MSTSSDAVSREPKRQRGRLRVAAIMEAGAEIFMERGYDAATMTEIAARSKTAIGSLYRFFPTKEALAEALLVRFANSVVEELNELRDVAQGMSGDQLASALVDFMMKLYRESSFAIRLSEAGGGDNGKRQKFREVLLAGMVAVLTKVAPGLKPPKAKVSASILLHILKGVAIAAEAEPRMRGLVLAELRTLVQAYLVALKKA